MDGRDEMDHVIPGKHSAKRTERGYAALTGFEHVDLERSRVFDIVAGAGSLIVYLDAALLSDHPQFVAEGPDSTFDHRGARIVFDHVSDLTWTNQRTAREVGLYGKVDHGPVGSLRAGNGLFEMTGDFGAITVRSFDCRLSVLEDSPPSQRVGAHRPSDGESRHRA